MGRFRAKNNLKMGLQQEWMFIMTSKKKIAECKIKDGLRYQGEAINYYVDGSISSRYKY